MSEARNTRAGEPAAEQTVRERKQLAKRRIIRAQAQLTRVGDKFTKAEVKLKRAFTVWSKLRASFMRAVKRREKLQQELEEIK